MIVATLQVTVAGNRTRLTIFSDHILSRHLVDRPVPLLSLPMTMYPEISQSDWLALLQRINREIGLLSNVERDWLQERLALIAADQVALDELFSKAGGAESCAGCDGACCGCGRHHLTLTNLLAYLFDGEDPPAPDFSSTCPYLSDLGCRLPAARRPYNCITFFCEALDDRLDSVERARLQTLDRQLRSQYQLIAERYPAASLRGLWIGLERVGGGQLLGSLAKDVVE